MKGMIQTRDETRKGRRVNKMSKNVADAPVTETLEKEYTYFDAELTQKSEKATVSFTAPANLQEAMDRISNNSDVVKDALTAYLRRAALKEARSAVLSKGISKKTVLNFIKAWREMPQYRTISERKEQTAQILKDIKDIPQILAMLKAKAAEDMAKDEDGDDDDE